MSSLELNELRGTLARDAQRAQQPLNLFYRKQNEQKRQAKRPLNIDDGEVPVESLTLRGAQKRLQSLLHTIAHKVGEIQDIRLGEPTLKALNDEINAALETKALLELRIAQLQGRGHKKTTSYSGGTTTRPYQYFGAYKTVKGIADETGQPNEADDTPGTSGRVPVVPADVVASDKSFDLLQRPMSAFYYGIGIDISQMERDEKEAELKIRTELVAFERERRAAEEATRRELEERKMALLAMLD